MATRTHDIHMSLKSTPKWVGNFTTSRKRKKLEMFGYLKRYFDIMSLDISYTHTDTLKTRGEYT